MKANGTRGLHPLGYMAKSATAGRSIYRPLPKESVGTANACKPSSPGWNARAATIRRTTWPESSTAVLTASPFSILSSCVRAATTLPCRRNRASTSLPTYPRHTPITSRTATTETAS